MEIQNEFVQLILIYVWKQLKLYERYEDKSHINEALEFMKDLGLTNEHLKEHVMSLCMDKKTVETFEALAPTVKAAFTRVYNSDYKENLTGKKGKKTKGSKADETALGDDEGAEEIEEDDDFGD